VNDLPVTAPLEERKMKRSTMRSGVLTIALLTMVAGSASGDTQIKTRLIGYEETPLTINSPGSGEFSATIGAGGTAIEYVLTYQDLSSPVLQAHIHFGRPAISGGIVLFLCTNVGGPAGTQACPNAPATITGVLTPANVIALPAQGIDAGVAGFAEVLKAIQADAAYVNVHTTNHPSGEIRGRLGDRDDDEDRGQRRGQH
jgi:hypothetical protein